MSWQPSGEPPEYPSLEERMPELRGAPAPLAAVAQGTPRPMRAVTQPGQSRNYDLKHAGERIKGERERRLENAKHRVPYGISFLDDAFGGLMPHDVVLVTARSGQGKTELASMILENSARSGKRVLGIPLEAEPDELERRIKYRLLAQAFYASARANWGDVHLSYQDWMQGELEDVLGPFEDTVNESFQHDVGANLVTCYRGEAFTEHDLAAVVEATHQDFDMCVLDHLHYVDFESGDKAGNEGLSQLCKRIRDLSLLVGKPFIVVCHVRKAKQEARRFRALMPELEDIHGAQDVTRMATRAVAIGRAPFDHDTWWMRPTLMEVLKNRPGGGRAEGWVAKVTFDTRKGAYGDKYEIGRVGAGKSGEEWFKVTKAPRWAKSCSHLNEQQQQLGGST